LFKSELSKRRNHDVSSPVREIIAISFALPTESSGFIARLRDKKETSCGDTKVIHGKRSNQSLAVLHTGVGPKSCERKLDSFFQIERPAYLISSGFAGAVCEDLQVGDLFLAENFSDQQLLSGAQRIMPGQRAHKAKLFTSPSIIDSIVERNQIARATGASAVDMETETIAKACARRGIPMLSLRAISDTPGKPLPVPPNVLFDIEGQRTDVGKLLSYLLMHPGSVWRLIAFSRQIAQARHALSDAIVDLLRRL